MITSTDYLTKDNQLIFIKIRRALFLSFLTLGFIMASWIVRTPSIRDILDASTMEMGFILFGFSIGSMGGIICVNKLIVKTGADFAVSLGLALGVSGLIVLALGSYMQSLLIITLGLGLIGTGVAISEVAVNFLGSHVEQKLNTPVLTLIHACFSLGTFIGAIWGIFLQSMDVKFFHHMIITFIFLVPLVIFISSQVYNAPGSKVNVESNKKNFFEVIHKDPRLLIIGFIVLAVALAEGTANDWLPLLIVDTHKVPEQFGTLIYIVFALTMTVGRVLGTRFLQNFSVSKVMRFSSILGAVGILILVFSNNIYITGFAVILWGIGASLGFPIAMSAGAGTGSDSAIRISILATIGYTAFLIGPPLLGFVGEHIGLRMMMLIIFILLFIPIIFSNSLLNKK